MQGYVTSGKGEGAGWTALPWFRSAVQDRFAFDPSPGTFNLTLAGDPGTLAQALLAAGTVRVPPSAAICCALLLSVRLAAAAAPSPVRAVLVRPLVPGYDSRQIELVAAVHLRSTLALADGDTLTFESTPGPGGWVAGR